MHCDMGWQPACHMNKYDSVVVFGCSLTKDNYMDTWADNVSAALGLPLINNAERGAGYEFVSDRVLNVLDDIKDSLCVIMWPSADRWDLWVNDATPQLQRDIEYASWLNGGNPDFCDLNGDYSKDHGYYMSGAVPRGLKHIYYKYFYTKEYHVNNALKTIVMVQNLLLNNGVDFVMCNTHPLTSLVQYHDDDVVIIDNTFSDHINLSYFVPNATEQGFIAFCKEHNVELYNTHYPMSDAHLLYTNTILLPKILELYAIDLNGCQLAK